MAITPELQQNIFYTVYFTVLHNFFALFYFMGIIISAGLAIMRPKRAFILMLIGFIILLFGFEYQKHILDSLREQTLNSLITIQEHYQVRRIINGILIKLIPLLLPFTGFGLLIAGGYLFLKEHKLK